MAGNTTHSGNDTTGVAANGARTLDTAADAAGVETRDHAAASYGIFEAVGAQDPVHPLTTSAAFSALSTRNSCEYLFEK